MSMANCLEQSFPFKLMNFSSDEAASGQLLGQKGLHVHADFAVCSASLN